MGTAAIGSHIPLRLIGGRFIWRIGYPMSGDNPYTGEPNGILYSAQFTFNSNGSGTAIRGIRQITYEGGLQSTVQTDIWFYTNVKWTFNGTRLTGRGTGWYTRTNSTNPAMNTRLPISDMYHFPLWRVGGSARHPILDIQEPFDFGGYSQDRDEEEFTASTLSRKSRLSQRSRMPMKCLPQIHRPFIKLPLTA